MYVNMKYILDNANRDGYAVMAVNSVNMEMARAVIEAAEEEHSPIIVQFGVGQMSKLAHPSEMVPMIKAMAERASVPVCLNLDHGPSLEAEIDAIKWGFSNVMIDASSLPYEENVRRTRMVVDLAHAKGISVEAELGHVGQAADGDGRTADMYTNVEQAVQFVKETGVDALAVAIGTAHGKYPAGFVPKLDFERLAELNVVSGTSANVFSPEKKVTRAEFAKMLVESCLKKTEQLALEFNDANTKKFKDLDSNEWYYKYVTIAINYELMSGYEDGTFRPNKEVTYSEIAKMVTRALGHTYLSENDPQGWDVQYIDKAWQENLFDHVEFKNPHDSATRGDVANIIWNMLTTNEWEIIYRNDTNLFIKTSHSGKFVRKL